MQCSSKFGFGNLLYEEEEKNKEKCIFRKVKLVNTIYEDHFLAFTYVHAKLQKF